MSSLCCLASKLLRPLQSFRDVIAASCSLGDQRRAPPAPPEVTTHRHRPIRGREEGGVLWREKTANQMLYRRPRPYVFF